MRRIKAGHLPSPLFSSCCCVTVSELRRRYSSFGEQHCVHHIWSDNRRTVSLPYLHQLGVARTDVSSLSGVCKKKEHSEESCTSVLKR